MSSENSDGAASSHEENSSNPGKIMGTTSLPDFVQHLDKAQKNLVEGLWRVPHLTINDKMDSIDEFSKNMPFKVQKEYRKWRFTMERDRLPLFVDLQNLQIQKIIKILYKETTDLDEFADMMYSIRVSFDDKNSFERWLKEECIDKKLDPQIPSLNFPTTIDSGSLKFAPALFGTTQTSNDDAKTDSKDKGTGSKTTMSMFGMNVGTSKK